MGEWTSAKLRDVANLSGGYAFKSTQYSDNGRFVLRTVNIRDDYSITKDGAVFIPEAEASEYERFALQDKDTLFVMVAATLGKVGLVRENILPALLNQNMWVIRAIDGKIDPAFLHYLFRELSKIPLSWVSGSARSFLRRDDVRNLEFSLPSDTEQRAIASVLYALDDKIELNRRMNETLERQARAIFKDWFVDFGPTCAKMEGRKPYLTPEIWNLFPDKLNDDGIPEGWEEKCVRDILELSYGKSLPAKKRIVGVIPVYGSGGITGAHNEALVKEPTIIVGRKGTVGSLYWQPTPCFPIDTVFYVKTRESLVFCYYLLQTLCLNTMNTDAAVPGLNRDNAYRLPVIWASEAVREAFDRLVVPLRESIDANDKESRILAQTRDLLLPKLMSGQIRVRNVEKQIGEAT